MSVHPLADQTRPRGPLHGVGVLVTRPARQAAGLSAQLAALDAVPVVFPAIVILPPSDRAALERAHAELESYDIAIFVSANAVEYGVPAPQRWPERLRTFAPGPGTAASLAAVGIADAVFPSDSFDSEGLLALPALSDVRGKRALIFRGGGGRELVGDVLQARGAEIAYVDCYRRAAPESGAQGLVEAMRDKRVHALTFTSSEGLDNLWRLLDGDGRALFAHLPAFVPHRRIAEHAEALGLATVVTEGSDAGLIAGLLEWFASHPITT